MDRGAQQRQSFKATSASALLFRPLVAIMPSATATALPTINTDQADRAARLESAVRAWIATYQPDLSCGLSWRAKDFDALLPGERAALVQDRLLLEAGSMVSLAPRLRLRLALEASELGGGGLKRGADDDEEDSAPPSPPRASAAESPATAPQQKTRRISWTSASKPPVALRFCKERGLALLDEWALEQITLEGQRRVVVNGRVYNKQPSFTDGEKTSTSAIQHARGRVVTTASGSEYYLGSIAPAFGPALLAVARQRNPSTAEIDEAAPLRGVPLFVPIPVQKPPAPPPPAPPPPPPKPTAAPAAPPPPTPSMAAPAPTAAAMPPPPPPPVPVDEPIVVEEEEPPTEVEEEPKVAVKLVAVEKGEEAVEPECAVVLSMVMEVLVAAAEGQEVEVEEAVAMEEEEAEEEVAMAMEEEAEPAGRRAQGGGRGGGKGKGGGGGGRTAQGRRQRARRLRRCRGGGAREASHGDLRPNPRAPPWGRRRGGVR